MHQNFGNLDILNLESLKSNHVANISPRVNYHKRSPDKTYLEKLEGSPERRAGVSSIMKPGVNTVLANNKYKSPQNLLLSASKDSERFIPLDSISTKGLLPDIHKTSGREELAKATS